MAEPTANQTTEERIADNMPQRNPVEEAKTLDFVIHDPVPAPDQPRVGRDHIMQFFAYTHLPPGLQGVSRPFAELALEIERDIPRNPERTVALRKLLEAKDAAVRAFIATPSGT